MHHDSRSTCRPALAAFSVLLAVFALRGQEPEKAQTAATPPLVNAPLADYQRELLMMAYDAVSLMPAQPHAKNRARAQANVVAACLSLDQPKLAQELAANIDDWHKGQCIADLALYCLDHGRIDAVQELLDQADHEAEIAKNDAQSWRRDRIRARIGEVQLRLGKNRQAGEYTKGVAPADLGTFDKAAARLASPADFAAQVKAIDQVVEGGNFEPIRNVLHVCVELYDRYHGDKERRQQMETRALDAYDKLPVAVRADIIVELVQSAVRHDDNASAQRFLDRADGLLENPAMPPEDALAMRGRLAALRGKAGQKEKGLKLVAAAVSQFYVERDHILDIDRGTALRPLAAAYAELGDRDQATRTYAAAIDEGLHNPNSRPRAEDLAGVCISMAKVGYQPDQAMRARLEQIKKGLGNPW